MAAFVFSSHVPVSESIPKLTLLSVINDLGSSAGLWLGVSLATVFTKVRDLGLGMAGDTSFSGFDYR